MKSTFTLLLICVIKFLDQSEANECVASCNRCTNQFDGKYDVAPISDIQYESGESPVYVDRMHSVFWVNFIVSSINRQDLYTNKTYSAIIGKMLVVFIIPVEDKPNYYVCGSDDNLAIICWDGYSTKVSSITILYEFNNASQMLDDGDVSKDGSRFIVDSTPHDVNTSSRDPSPVRLIYQKNPDNILFTVFGFANGLRFDPTDQYIYSANTDTREISRYPFYPNNTVGEPTVIFSFKLCGLLGGPDSFTVDKQGNIWVASDTGGTVLVIKPDTCNLIGEVKIGGPQLRVSNCIFGDKDYRILYVTTRYQSAAEKKAGGGKVYRVVFKGVNVQGFPRRLIKASTIVPDDIRLPDCPCSKQGY